MRLTHLCDMELAFDDNPVLVRPYGGEEGTAFGQGSGTVMGERLRGTARWDNFAHRRADGSMLPNLRGAITTEDGATILFTMRGRTIGLDTAEGRAGNQLVWVLFEAEDERYRWLSDALCVMEGKVHPNVGRNRGHLGRARVYLCVNELL